MKFILKRPKGNILDLLRRSGYHFRAKTKERGELVFYHPLAPAGFPRFHLFLKPEKDNLIFNLHLDQKKPVYKGTPAHNAEHEGLMVKKEAKRIKKELGL
ncbi:MAG: hypothetical protein CO031_02090 [Candidatus Nealsonbacteria bacterium CG_4_9_14_0_2_um_filter_37_38]|uniref:Uncharacterized protein n=1 Tax=Candidatus Nealsonbacteria bacterium CG_4_10_14_0_8_um_filter_37_14 TaxID=1974684 RepID=A0A2M7R5N1_9BACT|nr:MAG: hypothetical protein COV63_00160 [Candidatus Nealsonbacteria bacterium CG11_big_fil_rev_8_21_14_0_20_37_68]PIY88712.1 MAG: hypothetical protein COY73_03040 [Candidatus Nealsonbacteria bacterium CG_4_10_14_0_8_um_filter_37_14]PJC51542.1 MAG: hypothetical protein CO031_02090 [Candidatus Nealsonbacteria bacterium CG_4_9_14_0_2_um_filter_37_38]